MKLLFYSADYAKQDPASADSNHPGVEVWKPSWLRFVPPGLPLFPFLIFWLFHYFRIFANREYTVLLIRDGNRVVHCSTIVPSYFRFPFMRRDDVQIGTWTAPDHRGRGFARLALKQAMALTQRRSGRLWYIVRKDNLPSLQIAATSGFTLMGSGTRVLRFGFGAVGKFVLEAPLLSDENLRGAFPIVSSGANTSIYTP